jgi:hemerythrin-like domain-containing protein
MSKSTEGTEDMDPIEALLNEHGLIRRFVDTLAAATERMEDGDPPPREFFSMASEELDDGDMAAIVEEFQKERERHGADTFERYHKTVVEMRSILVHF